MPFDLHYRFPEGAYLLPMLPMLMALCWHAQQRRNRYVQKLAPMAERRSTLLYSLKSLLFIAAWLAAIVALMQPVGRGHYPEEQAPDSSSAVISLKRKAHDLLLLIDVSASMAANDTPLGKSRLDYAKEIADEIVSHLSGESVSLYLFTSQPQKAVPFTMDYLFTRLMIANLAINENGVAGTDFTTALAPLQKGYFPASPAILKTAIVISDGGDTAIEGLQGDLRRQAIDKLTSIMTGNLHNNLRLYTIGIGSIAGVEIPGISDHGSPVHSKLQGDLLEAIARQGRGKYFDSNATNPLTIARELYSLMQQDPAYFNENEGLLSNSVLQQLVSDTPLLYEQYYQWPLALTLLLLLIAAAIPERWQSFKGTA
jgi:Ca-activated chloride channel family protein